MMNGGHGLPPSLSSLPAFAIGAHGLPTATGVDFAAQARFGLGGSIDHPLAGPHLMVPYGLPAGAVPGLAEALRAYNHMPVLPLANGDLMSEAAALAENLERLQLNPAAKEFVPPSLRGGYPGRGYAGYSPNGRAFDGLQGRGAGRYTGRGGGPGGRGAYRGGGGRGRGRAPAKKKNVVQKGLEDNVRRTIYICDIDQQVTEEQLANLFLDCGQVVDCRVCGDPNSAMRFAFIEFTEEESAQKAVTKSGTQLGNFPLRVLPSKTAIVPVNNDYLPRTIEEREQCGRTVYAANIDRKVDKTDVKTFFETLCGPVSKIRLLGDSHHSTRIAFVEFAKAESAKAALNCSGALLGSLPIRVSPSKTPVRVDPRDNED